MAAKERVRLQLFVDQKIADRLDKLGKSMGWSRNEVAGLLLEMGTSGHPWIANQLGAMVSGAVLKALGKGSPESDRPEVVK